MKKHILQLVAVTGCLVAGSILNQTGTLQAEAAEIAVSEETESTSIMADLKEEDILYQGKDGKIEWCIDKDGVLYLEGNGSYATPADWTADEYKTSIKKAIVNMSGMRYASGMFCNCRNLEEIDFVHFDTSEVVYMDDMFSACLSLKEVDLSGCDTSNVVLMKGMFEYCKAIERIDLSGWDISGVSSLEGFFLGCNALKEIKLEGWETSNVTDTSNMFWDCKALKKIDIRTWDMSNVTNANWMFEDVENLTELYLPESLKVMGINFLDDTKSLRRLYIPSSITDLSEAYISDNTIIICNEGSAAHQWAKENGQRYSLLGHVHKYEGTVLQNATSSKKGIIKCECTVTGCDEFYYMAYEYGHNIVTKAGTAATCTVSGLTDGSYCKTCNKEIIRQEPIPAGHKEVADAAVSPTCEKTGLTKGSHCSVCNKVLVAQETVPATGHTKAVDSAVSATCEKSGLTEGSHCSVCNKVLVAQKVVPAKGHTEVVDKAIEAGCEATGLTEGSHCSVCDKTLVAQKVIPATGHTEVTDEAVEATCQATGLTEGSHCSVCNKILVEQKTVNKKSHSYNETVIQAAIGKDGSIAQTCAVCQESTSIIIPAIDTVVLSKTEYTYNGKTQKPTVTIKDREGTELIKDTDYKVSYSKGCKKAGSYTVTVKFQGNYNGSKKLTYTINPKKYKSCSLSKTTYTYDGKTKKPTVTIKGTNGKKLTKDTDYTVSYSKGCKNPGVYTVTVKFKGDYSGNDTKTLTYTIKPKSVSISKVTAKSKGFKVTVKKGTAISGYEIQYSTSKQFTKKTTEKVILKGTKTTSKTISKLKAKKKYYVRVRTYKTVTVNGKSTKIYSSWSKVKNVTTKK